MEYFSIIFESPALSIKFYNALVITPFYMILFILMLSQPKQPFFIPCSLLPPLISSFTLFLGSECHSCVNLSVWRDLVLCDISACVTHFIRLFNVVNNPFKQRKDSYSLSPIDGASFNSRIPRTYFEESGSRLMQNSRAKNS